MSDFALDSRGISFGATHPNDITCSVDTLRAFTLNPIDENLIKPLYPKSERVDPYGWRLNYFDEDQSIFFHRNKKGIVAFELSLSTFKTVSDALEYICRELGPWALEARISRLDVNVNFPQPFNEVFHGLDFGKKRTCERWGAHATGESFYIGVKGKRWELIVYDKRKESRSKKNKGKPPIKHPCTRIEIVTLPKKKMLVRELSLLRNHRPFGHVKRYSVKLIPPVQEADESTKEFLKRFGRYHEFKARYEDWGFFLARRKIAVQTQRNFHLHYGDFYSRQIVRPSLDEIFLQGITAFVPEQKDGGGRGKRRSRSL